MGYWCTLHLFDHEKFYFETIQELKGQKGDLFPLYKTFLKTHITGGTNHLSSKELDKLALSQLESIYKISNSFGSDFKNHTPFHSLKNWEREQEFLSELDGHYDFCKFFEFYIFESCSDFYSHIPLGKGGIARNFELKTNSLSYNIISNLDSWNSFFLQDTFGITNWITNEDLKLLLLDKENLTSINDKIGEAIISLIELATNNNLGLIAGVDLNIDRNELLAQNKLLPSSVWNDQNSTSLLFEYVRN